MRRWFILMTLVLFIQFVPEAFAQNTNVNTVMDTTTVYRIEMNDGSVFVGTIISRDAVKIVLKTAIVPRIELPLINLTRIQEVSANNFKKGVYWFDNPHASRHYYGPSAIPLKKGDGYYQNTWIFLNSFQVGITNNFSIGGGFEIFSLLGAGDVNAGSYNPIFFLTPKLSYKIGDNLHLGGGLLYVNAPIGERNQRGGFGITYGVATVGNKNYNMTGGMGWGFVNGKFSSTPTLTFSGMARIARKVSFISENWLVPANGYYSIFTYGLRIMGENTAFDMALIVNSDIATVFPLGIPFISYTIRF